MSNILRPVSRIVARSAPRRLYATNVPGPEPGATKPATNPPSGGSNAVPITLALLAVGGAGYWYMNSTGKDEEVKAKAHELKDAGEARAREMKKEGEAKANAYKKEGEVKYDEGKNAVQQNYEKVKGKVESAVDKTQAATHDAVESAKATGSSWWSWGSGKADSAKQQTAGKVEEGAGKVQQEAAKRS